MAETAGRSRRNRALERRTTASTIERDGQEVDMPCERCWNTRPKRRYVMIPGSNKCSGYVRLGKKCSGPNVAQACTFLLIRLLPLLTFLVIANISARDKVDKEIADAKRQLSEALARLSCLRRQHESLGNSRVALLNRGLTSLEEEEEGSASP
ncbi:hypothetical protein P885DRAFT_48145 [Corynascus similis CBS 632.67]